jgi:hypothetical protein
MFMADRCMHALLSGVNPFFKNEGRTSSVVSALANLKLKWDEFAGITYTSVEISV